MLLAANGDLIADAPLTGDTTLKSATLQIPPQSGRYQLLAVLQGGNGQVVAQSARSISLVTPQQLPVALGVSSRRTTPASSSPTASSASTSTRPSTWPSWRSKSTRPPTA